MATGIGKRLEDVINVLREEHGKTQKYIADALELNENTLLKYKREASYPTLDVVGAMMQKFNVNPMYLLSGQRPMLLIGGPDLVSESSAAYGNDVKALLQDKQDVIDGLRIKLARCEERLQGDKS